MNTELSKINTSVTLPDADLLSLADKIVEVIENGKQALAISISETIKTTYWQIGRHIVEFEQEGNRRAKYGASLLSNLAKILRVRAGKGYSRPNLNNMRKFYLLFPKCQTSDKSAPNFQTSDKLTWSHICELITIDDDLDREEGMLAPARGVAIKAKSGQPAGNMVVFSAATGDETAYPNADEQHGLFTFYLLKKLQETKGDVTLQELGTYITTNVRQQSIVKNGKSQTPCVTPSSSLSTDWQNWKLK